MSLTLTGSGGLFTRIGAIASVPYLATDAYFSNVSVGFDTAAATLTTEYGIVSQIAPGKEAYKQAVFAALKPYIQTPAIAILTKQVNDDASLPNNTDVNLAVAEVIRQMKGAGASVKACTISGSSSAGSSNNGNGSVVISMKRGDGLNQANCFDETGLLKCTGDSQTSGLTLGREAFVYYGDPAADPWSVEWPAGSGAEKSLVSVDSLESVGVNILNNSSWETINSTNDGWTGWVISTGTYNTDLTTDATQYYRGVKSLKIVGGATTTGIYQNFNDSTVGTSSKLSPLTQYAVVIRHKVDVVPAAGVLTVELTDQSNTLTADAQSVNNSKTVTLSGLTTAWSSTTTTFRTPAVVPTNGFRLRVRISTALSSGTNLYIDDLAMTPMEALYKGGPNVAIFAGSTKWIQDDYFTMTFANNRGGASYGGTFQAVFDRFFNTRDAGLLLPENASPTISDSLIN